ncbi:MAG: sporulation protein YqfD [Clostridia bacterium]|nr:sporulation protein YqfD [Clostridia bacterium]
MKIKSRCKILIKGLNQERILNVLSSFVELFEIDRIEKSTTSFKCFYKDRKKVLKFLKDKNIEILSVQNEGIFAYLDKFWVSYGIWSAIIAFVACFAFQYQFIINFNVFGIEKLTETQVVEFVKQNSSRKKSEIILKDLELSIYENFDEISFVSCSIRGQTLIVNIKEKLLPSVMENQFFPIVAEEDAKITKIELTSGTLCVAVGDYVKKGDVLVQPFVEDASGNIKQVEAKAQICGEVYNQASIDHYDKKIEIRRTGRMVELHQIELFGLKVYSFSEEFDFKMYEVEHQETNLAKNLLLPFVLRKTFVYEIEEVLIEKSFEQAKEECVEKARQKALKNCEDCDIILYEFYTTRQLSGVTIVTYCIVTEQNIGGVVSDC